MMIMSRTEMKRRAKMMLGSHIFGGDWMTGMLVCLVFSLVEGFVSALVPGIGAILIIGPLTYGICRIFLEYVRTGEPMQIGEMFYGFSEDFVQNFLIGLMTTIFCALWGLLFVIPGIVKAYSYELAYYIKHDHPEYDWRTCLLESSRLMKGHKMDLFVLDLSFLGWYFVGALAFGVGVLWVVPYHRAARSIFYDQITLSVLH